MSPRRDVLVIRRSAALAGYVAKRTRDTYRHLRAEGVSRWRARFVAQEIAAAASMGVEIGRPTATRASERRVWQRRKVAPEWSMAVAVQCYPTSLGLVERGPERRRA